MSLTRVELSLQEIELFDPSLTGLVIGSGRGEQRALCPLCGQGKPRDAAHRCLSLNRGTGVWRCHRCGEGGKVREMWQERAPLSSRQRSRSHLAQIFDAPREAPLNTPTTEEKEREANAWKSELRSLRALEETRGAVYLDGRGISLATAQAAGSRFCADFMGRPAVVFPLRDRSGILRGAHARYVDGRDWPKARTLGDKKNALFASENALDVTLPALLVTEAPIDALSLAVAGFPSVALCGTQPPHWMHRICAFRRVLLAFDADDAGDLAAAKLEPLWTSFGARCERLRPQKFKDWNQALIAGQDELTDWLAYKIL